MARAITRQAAMLRACPSRPSPAHHFTAVASEATFSRTLNWCVFFWFVLLFLQETLRKPKKTYCLLRFHLWMVCFISTNSRWLQPSNAWHHRDWAQRFQTELPTSASAHLAPLTESGWRLGAGCCRNSSSVKPQSPASRSHPTGAFKDKLPQISSSSSDIRNEASLWNVSNIQMVQTKE